MPLTAILAAELGAGAHQVQAAVRLLDEGATVPFIARYRKEATGGLDDVQLRQLAARLTYLRELGAQRDKVLEAIRAQGKLTPSLEAALRQADTKALLDDLYLPYKVKRQTKASKAREAGLEALADQILARPHEDPARLATRFVRPALGFATAEEALDGAQAILIERVGEDTRLVSGGRDHIRARGRVSSTVVTGKAQEGARFRDWFDYTEAFREVPSHRALALFRGESEGILKVRIVLDDRDVARSEQEVARFLGVREHGRPGDVWGQRTVTLAWRRLSERLVRQLLTELKARASDTAMGVFAHNLRDLLLAAPAGPQVTMGLDPGIRTGVKVAVVDGTGKVLTTDTLYPGPPRHDVEGAKGSLRRLIARHQVALIAIGNGTGSRETDRLVAEVLASLEGPRPARVVVSEAGASVYSASEVATHELGQLDVSLRGAVSIARRLQDPLAELVKIEPRAIGVGQYQHDLPQADLARALDDVVEDCVNAVGVDVNTASAPLLARVAGLSPAVADHVVAWRDQHGRFTRRKQLLEVSRLGPQTFEQCAGFLRIVGGEDPLDASAVHPEAYPVVRRICQATGRSVQGLLGDHALLTSLRASDFTDERFGEPTVRDILAELDKPGRDPRPTFATARLAAGVETVEDLATGMVLEGTVTNVTAFGAFVDVGVHQDGLVHISKLSDRFVRDPRDVVRAGQVVTVAVLAVDRARQRIQLSMQREDIEGA